MTKKHISESVVLKGSVENILSLKHIDSIAEVDMIAENDIKGFTDKGMGDKWFYSSIVATYSIDSSGNKILELNDLNDKDFLNANGERDKFLKSLKNDSVY